MKISRLYLAAISLAALTLFGCGGGGGGTSGPPAGSTTIKGTVALGLVQGADVTVYAIRPTGVVDRSASIGTGKTAADGSYTITLSSAPTGPAMVEVTGGTYKDEASGTTGVPLKGTLHTLVSSVKDGDKIAVTALTELAFHQAEGVGGANAFSSASIDDANQKIGLTFGVDNIVTSTPFDPTAVAPATASPDDKRYAAAVGIFSQLVEDQRKGVLTTEDSFVKLMLLLETELETSAGFSSATLSSINTALTGFTSKNQGGTLPAPITFKAGVLTISTSGTLAAGITTINGIDVTVTLPTGVTVKADALGEVDPSVLLPSTGAATNSIVSGKYTAASGTSLATLRLVLLNVQPGVAVGEFMHVNFSGFPGGTDLFTVAVNQISGSGPANATATLSGITTTFFDAGF